MKAATLLVLSVLLAGCAFNDGIAVQFAGTSPVSAKESFTVEVSPHRVQGVTKRRGQVVRIDCAVTIVYDVIEATGAAVLAQRYEAHLRTRRLRSRTPYEFDCDDPLISF